MKQFNTPRPQHQLVVVANRIQGIKAFAAYNFVSFVFMLLSLVTNAQSNNDKKIPALDGASKDPAYIKRISKADAQRSLDATIVAERKISTNENRKISSASNEGMTNTKQPTIWDVPESRSSLKNNSGDPVHGVDVKLGNKNKSYGDPIPGLDDKPGKSNQANGDPVHGVDVKLGATQKSNNGNSKKNKTEHWGDPHENLNGYKRKNKIEHWGDPHENLNGLKKLGSVAKTVASVGL